MNASPAPDGHHGPVALLASMAHTRLELAALDLEAHAAATAASLLKAVVAVFVALIGLAFIGVSVIAYFWDSRRLLACLVTTAVYLLVAAVLAAWARSSWNSRPPAFAAVLHELERDREALRGRL